MGQDLFRYLPTEITLNILSRLDACTVVRCKCVCKPWLDLLATLEFVKSHLSKSVPGLTVIEHKLNSKTYNMVEFVDEVDLNCDRHYLNIAFNLDLPFCEPMQGSANGLIFLGGFRGFGNLILCNPVTREYIALPCPRQPSSKTLWENYGFGVSRMSGQYKVVRIFYEKPLQAPLRSNSIQFECQAYTVGTGSWRSVTNGSQLGRSFGTMMMVFLSGNLHWWTTKRFSPELITYLDLETELLSTFSDPPCDDPRKSRSLSILRGCLCVCDDSIHVGICASYDIDIWVMKVYGDENSWTKEFTVRNVDMGDYLGPLFPVKVFKHGDILLSRIAGKPLYYSSKTKTTKEVHIIHKADLLESESNTSCDISIYSPSFLSLKTFATENVSSF